MDRLRLVGGGESVVARVERFGAVLTQIHGLALCSDEQDAGRGRVLGASSIASIVRAVRGLHDGPPFLNTSIRLVRVRLMVNENT